MLSRHQFLRSSTASIALPLMGRAAEKPASVPNRLLVIHLPLSVMPEYFFPKNSDTTSPYLNLLSPHRGKFTVFSGLSHPGVGSNHHAGQCFLTGAPGPGTPTFRNTISMDQIVSEAIGLETRFPYISASTSVTNNYKDHISVSNSGVGIPMINKASEVYNNLFVVKTKEEKAAALRDIQAGQSILDTVLDETKKIKRTTSVSDHHRLEQYFQSIREMENRLKRELEWNDRPKPKTKYAKPNDIVDSNQVFPKTKTMFDLIKLAFQSDSTRVITFSLNTFSTIPALPGVQSEVHNLTHHGNQPSSIKQLKKIEEAQMNLISDLLSSLNEIKESGGSLLDNTQVLLGSCLGNANSHSNKNLPILLAGGGYKHKEHIAFDSKKNTPLANLFVTMFQHFKLDVKKFSSSTGNINQLI